MTKSFRYTEDRKPAIGDRISHEADTLEVTRVLFGGEIMEAEILVRTDKMPEARRTGHTLMLNHSSVRLLSRAASQNTGQLGRTSTSG